MSGPLALVSIVLESIRVSLMVRHRSRVSDYLPVDGHWGRRTDQSCLGVSDCKGPQAVVDLEDLVEDCGQTFLLFLADELCVRSTLENENTKVNNRLAWRYAEVQAGRFFTERELPNLSLKTS